MKIYKFLGWIVAVIFLIVFSTLVVNRQIKQSYEKLQPVSYQLLSNEISLRFVLISDLHNNELGIHNEALIETISEHSPQLIFIVGDMLNEDSSSSAETENLIENLAAIAPVYYALGNHELEYIARTDDALIDKLTAAGATVLDLAYEDIEVNGQKVRIGGMYDYAFALDGHDSTNPETMDPDVYDFLMDFQDTDAFTLMMSHRPESFVLGEASKTWDIDLVVSGHDHGGQVVLPFFGGLWAGDQGWFPEYVHGLHQKDKLNILITSGLGSHVQKLPRFNNPPEVVVCTILPEEY